MNERATLCDSVLEMSEEVCASVKEAVDAGVEDHNSGWPVIIVKE